ncbi:unnamed protein product [Cunninghamella echinulata]
MRSKIGSYFAELWSILSRFSGQIVVLLNIKYFKNLFQLNDYSHHNKWRLENFDYIFSGNRELNTNVSLKTVYKLDKINDIKTFN